MNLVFRVVYDSTERYAQGRVISQTTGVFESDSTVGSIYIQAQ